jgi:hypothetical protein
MQFDQIRLMASFYSKAMVMMKIIGPLNARFNPAYRRVRAERWEALRQSLAGHHTWLVVGNGPSLKIEDLEALSSIPAIASNKINLLFSRTSWRPRLYTIGDSLLMHKLPAEHYDDFDEVLLPDVYHFMCHARSKLPWRFISDPKGERQYVSGSEELSPVNGFFAGHTITCPNIELAIWAGAKRVYVIGIDHSYKRENNVNSKRSVHAGGADHFDPSYRKLGEVVNTAPIDGMEQGYQYVRDLADKRGVEVINISRKTMLEAFKLGTVEEAVKAIASRGIES